jgi:hypothetical protein
VYKYKYKYLCKYAPADEGWIKQAEDRWWEGGRSSEVVFKSRTVGTRVTPVRGRYECVSSTFKIRNWDTWSEKVKFSITETPYANQIIFAMRQGVTATSKTSPIFGLSTIRNGDIRNRYAIIDSPWLCIGNVENANEHPFWVEISEVV